MGTRVPKGSGKKGKVKTVDEVYDVVDHELKPYKPKLINAASKLVSTLDTVALKILPFRRD